MVGVYIHIPFCHQICDYCDFCKVLYNKKYGLQYLDNLSKEIAKRYHNEVCSSIYIGGGTPSCLSNDELIRLLEICKVFVRDIKCEFTIECNIGDINRRMLDILKTYGVNRISIGVQSFNKDILKILNRDYCDDDIISNICLVKEYFDNFSVDLIYAVSDDVQVVMSDVKKLLMLDVPHISLYSLMIEEHTKLCLNGYQYISSEIDRIMFDKIDEVLTKNNYLHYEISNYAKNGYMSQHNLRYWHNMGYYGFGLGAVSYINNYRITNTKSLTRYLDGEYLMSKIYEDKQMNKENDLILGLRLLQGVNYHEFNRKYHTDILENKVIKDLIRDNLLVIRGEYLACNREYIYVLNSILEKIIGSEL